MPGTVSADVPPPLEVDSARRIFGLETEFGLHLDAPNARAVTPEAPDRIDAPDMSQFAVTQGAPAAVPVQAQPAATPAPAPAPTADALPRSGGVRPEYENSGRWIERP